ncbi:MAG: hypothetical protein ABI533_04715 [Betaproteobacteria bacterium]
MSDATATARGLLVWAIPFAAVAAAIGIETDWGRALTHEAPHPAVGAPQPVAVALLPEYQIDGGIESRRETVDRVLFNPTRRPAPPASQSAAAAASMKRGQYLLTGTTRVGDVVTALLREVNGGKARTVRQGDTLDGMKVAEVKSDRVRLKQGDEFEDLSLKIATGPRSTVQTVTAVPPGVPMPGALPSGATTAAIGGSAGGTGRAITRPVAPPPAAPAAVGAGGNVSVSEMLAQRRRLAREAAAAAAGGQPIVTPGPVR